MYSLTKPENEVETYNTWTGWPPRPILSLYGPDGILHHRSRSAKFDLTDTLEFYTGDPQGFAIFGISSNSSVTKMWTHDELLRQESNIRHDLAHDAFEVDTVRRIKGLGLKCREEAIWELNIYAA